MLWLGLGAGPVPVGAGVVGSGRDVVPVGVLVGCGAPPGEAPERRVGVAEEVVVAAAAVVGAVLTPPMTEVAEGTARG
ncbi:hypothetical protein ACFW1F_25205 [Streptomyces bungoensis]|uniref:hypothetical protein n=1 Tax=Streptomyces bungoensis TaxID=285568 RepID=UPI0034135C73